MTQSLFIDNERFHIAADGSGTYLAEWWERAAELGVPVTTSDVNEAARFEDVNALRAAAQSPQCRGTEWRARLVNINVTDLGVVAGTGVAEATDTRETGGGGGGNGNGGGNNRP